MRVRLSRRYGFSASHRLHSPALTDAENQETYGKCNNPHGHGHNYEVELTVRGAVDPVSGRVIDLARLDALAEREILAPFRYRNLNEEFAAFRQAVPTTENLGLEVDRRLRAAWGEMFPATDRQLEPATGPQLEPAMGPQLEKVRIWETDRNICEITDVE